jgi:hypothetical protein
MNKEQIRGHNIWQRENNITNFPINFALLYAIFNIIMWLSVTVYGGLIGNWINELLQSCDYK